VACSEHPDSIAVAIPVIVVGCKRIFKFSCQSVTVRALVQAQIFLSVGYSVSFSVRTQKLGRLCLQ
jgi:hypothetical protein